MGGQTASIYTERKNPTLGKDQFHFALLLFFRQKFPANTLPCVW
jgi:hypothetical protein